MKFTVFVAYDSVRLQAVFDADFYLTLCVRGL